jgi:hypothetical protein
MMFYDVPMNQSVSTEDSRGLTSYIYINPLHFIPTAIGASTLHLST